MEDNNKEEKGSVVIDTIIIALQMRVFKLSHLNSVLL